jgi:hypothetical protein
VPAADRTFDNDASRWPVGVGDRPSILDDEAPLRNVHLERSMVEIERIASLTARLDRLVDPSIHPNEPTSRTQRKPPEVDPDVWQFPAGSSRHHSVTDFSEAVGRIDLR